MTGDGTLRVERAAASRGLSIWDANPKIVDALREAGALLRVEKFEHSYMHCWRHKTPIIYRATSQWFAGHGRRARTTAAPTLRETALAAIDATRFFPSWGKSRLSAMIANRPDWTLSRQRQWGVPMAFFVHRETGALHPRHARAARGRRERDRARRHRGLADDRRGRAARRYDRGTPETDASMYMKNRDTLDVWFDSGSTFQTVLGGTDHHGSHADELRYPADLYLEGSDQHRGWFHSSLLISCMLNGRAPYDALLTHGFVVDGDGRKMSKSLGNVIAPQKLVDQYGADIVRWWAASTDYSGDLSISDEILKRVVESYRRIRNTLRFLLANTSDFDPKRARAAGRRVARDRPLRDRAARRAADRAARASRRVRVPAGHVEAADVSAPRISAASISTC